MDKQFLYKYLSSQKLAVVATINSDGQPEAALVGVAFTGELEMIFDTDSSSRKYQNLLYDPHIAAVIGSANEITVQFEGIAKKIEKNIDSELLQTYFAIYPDGKERFNNPAIVHFVVQPKWIRYSNYNNPVII